MRDTVRTVEPTAPQAGHLELLQHGLHLGRVRVEEVQDAVAEVLAGGLPGNATKLNSFITGVRYAWSAAPCCPTIDRGSLPCPPNSCPIRGWNSTLPANP